MKIIGITACTAGIAHTYIVAEKIQQAATEAGHECKIETQGTIGAQNELTPEDIKAADVVILAHDILSASCIKIRNRNNCWYYCS